MVTTDRSAHPSPRDTARIRLTGWSPGTGSLLGAWLASAAIARLTGATAVILMLAATLVAMVFEIAAGWWSARSVHVGSALAPDVVTVGDRFTVLISIDGPTSARAIERRRVTLTTADGTIVSVAEATNEPGAPPYTDSITVCVESPGVLTTLTVSVHAAGPASLIWWKRNQTIEIDPLHVAPGGHGPLLEVETTAATVEGSVAAPRGNHSGEIDGVRPWRRGDSTNSVHWASSLRTDELIVHDRLTVVDEHWLIDLVTAEAARLRWTLDEARRLGHEVAVRAVDGVLHVVHDADDAARWSALAAQMQTDRDRDDAARSRDGRRFSVLFQPIRLRPTAAKPPTPITGPTRWTAAAAAFASMAMLTGALDESAASLVLEFVAVVIGAAVSLWVARRGGRRPVVMQAAIVAAIVVALAYIAMRATEVDGLLSALRGPLPNMLLLLVVLHGFETVDRRTLRVHLAITFVLASYAAGLRIDGRLGWGLAAWGIPFAASLLTTMRQPRTGAERAAHRSAIDATPSAGRRFGEGCGPPGGNDRRTRCRHAGRVEPRADPRRSGTSRTPGVVIECPNGRFSRRARGPRRHESVRQQRGDT